MNCINLTFFHSYFKIDTAVTVFSSPGRSPGRAFVLPPVLGLVSASGLASGSVAAPGLAKR